LEWKVAGELRGKKVAILAADGVERVEVEQPREALQQAGADTDLLSLREGEVQGPESRSRAGRHVSG
jgi:protease I